MASSKQVSCEQCHRGKVNTAADIWCYNCEEGLCTTCSGQHKRFNHTGDHKTIDIKSYKPSIRFIKTECDKHNQQLNLYCPSHLLPCCDECISTHHSKCTGIKRLASVAEEAKIDLSKASAEKDITSILLLLNKMANEKLRNMIKGEQQHNSIKESFNEIREEINKHLDHLEIKLYKEVDTVWSLEKSNLTGLITEIEERKKNLMEIEDDLLAVTANRSKLQSFLGMHQIEQKVHQYRYAVDIENDEMASEVDIELEQNDEIEKLLSELQSLKSFGEVKVVKSKITMSREMGVSREPQVPLQKQTNINHMTMNIETKMEINLDNYISDMISLMDGRVIVVEQWGKVNLLTSDGKLQKQSPIHGGAFSVTQINQDTIAITYPREKAIKIYNMENESVTKVIALDKICWGLSCSKKSLAVGLKKSEICILDLEGNMLRSIHVQSESPLYHLVHCNDRVICSDLGGKAVFCVDESGKQIWQYNQDLEGPTGLCVDTYGNIIITDFTSDRIIVISKDGKDCKTLLRREDGLKDMECICYKNNESYGIVCDTRGNNLLKFNLTYEKIYR
ncbi:unnamed protein product [Mytilus coruscus]|uniref:B box-type domain-containing protein n=1 Tax=Mytilus coruscus TaxID=42192 RepID=A0A6J8D6K3_MYTCO|nr:unnamed protein product [Mytilus coruscus]